MELFWSIVNRQAPPVRDLNAGVPSAMGDIIARLLEKDARQRYQTARDVVTALRTVYPTRAVRRVARQKVQRQWFRRLAGCTLGVLMSWALMPVAFALSNFAEHAIEMNPLLTASVWAGTDKIHDMKSVVDPAINPASAWISNDGRVVYSTRRRHGRGGLWLAVPGKPSHLLARDAEEAAVGPLGRYVYFTRYGDDPGLFKTRLDPLRGQDLVRLAAGVIEKPVVSADGTVVVFARRSETGFNLWSVRTDGSDPVRLSARTWDSAPIVSPNLKRMAIAYPARVLVCDAPACTEQSWVAVSSLVGWTPDGEGLTHTGDPGSSNIWVTRIRDGAVRQITRFGDQAITSISWSPNGRRVTVTRQHILTDLAWFTVLR